MFGLPIEIALDKRTLRRVDRFLDLFERLIDVLDPQRSKLTAEILFMTILPDDAKPFKKLVTVKVKDSEDNVLPSSSYTFNAVSDNPDAIAVTFEQSGTNQFTIHYTVGSPGPDGADAIANVNATVIANDDNRLLGAGVDSYTVTVGAASVAEITFGDAEAETP